MVSSARRWDATKSACRDWASNHRPPTVILPICNISSPRLLPAAAAVTRQPDNESKIVPAAVTVTVDPFAPAEPPDHAGPRRNHGGVRAPAEADGAARQHMQYDLRGDEPSRGVPSPFGEPPGGCDSISRMARNFNARSGVFSSWRTPNARRRTHPVSPSSVCSPPAGPPMPTSTGTCCIPAGRPSRRSPADRWDVEGLLTRIRPHPARSSPGAAASSTT